MLTPEQQEIILQYRPLALALARYKQNSHVEKQELQGVALLALCEAVAEYDPELGVPLQVFITKQIKYAISDYFRRQNPFHIDKKAYWTAIKLKDDERDDEIIAQELGFPVKYIATLRKMAARMLVGIDSPSGDDGETIGDEIPAEVDVETEVIEKIDREQELKDIEKAVEKLSPLRRAALSLRIGLPFGMEEFDFPEVLQAAKSEDATRRAVKDVRSNVGVANKGGGFDYSKRGDSQSLEKEARKRRAADFWRRVTDGEEKLPVSHEQPAGAICH